MKPKWFWIRIKLEMAKQMFGKFKVANKYVNKILVEHLKLKLWYASGRAGPHYDTLTRSRKKMHRFLSLFFFPLVMATLKNTRYSTWCNEYVYRCEHTSTKCEKHPTARCLLFILCVMLWNCALASSLQANTDKVMLTKSWNVVTRTQRSRRIVTLATIN